MFTVLIVEDDKNLRNLMNIKLNKEGYNTVTAENGKVGLEVFYNNHVDIVLVDDMMPIMSGCELVSNLREQGSSVPVIMLTAKGTIEDKEHGFLSGVDDYMVKPIDFNEMLLRMKAVLRRAKIVNERRITIKNTVLDYETLTVFDNDNKVALTKTEFGILYKLLSYPERSFSKGDLFEEFWPWDSNTEEEIVKVYINRIRNKIQPFSCIDVETVRGIGYRGVKNES